MHYKFLSELGGHYSAEEGTEGERRAALTGLEGALNNALMNLNALYSAAAPQAPPNGTVAQRAQFFKSAAEFSNKSKADIETPAILAAKAKVARYKRWLVLQGAEIKEIGGQLRIDWGISSRTVVYDRNVSQVLTRVRFSGGRLYSDDAFTKPLDTKNMVTHFSGPGFAIYVMSEEGNIHVGSHSVGYRHHSTLLAGTNVAGAGEVQIEKGKLVWISNKSGHYAPSAPHFLQVLHQLQKKGVDLSVVKVKYLQKPPTPAQNFDNVGLYLAAMEAGGLDSYDYAKLLRYLVKIPYSEFAVLAAAKGWRWVNGPEFAMGKRGIVTIAGGAPVSNKEARRWLKDIGRDADPDVQSGVGR
ncbi:MAG: hypothetical protein JO138_10750 [Acidobacteriaceae bacterium]|nr:hypothetical protein [Acidobacteriaceae bacterium]